MTKRPTKRPTKRTLAVQFRLLEPEMRAVESAAAKEERSVAFIARRALLEWLKTESYLK